MDQDLIPSCIRIFLTSVRLPRFQHSTYTFGSVWAFKSTTRAMSFPAAFLSQPIARGHAGGAERNKNNLTKKQYPGQENKECTHCSDQKGRTSPCREFRSWLQLMSSTVSWYHGSKSLEFCERSTERLNAQKHLGNLIPSLDLHKWEFDQNDCTIDGLGVLLGASQRHGFLFSWKILKLKTSKRMDLITLLSSVMFVCSCFSLEVQCLLELLHYQMHPCPGLFMWWIMTVEWWKLRVRLNFLP